MEAKVLVVTEKSVSDIFARNENQCFKADKGVLKWLHVKKDRIVRILILEEWLKNGHGTY